MRYTKSYIENRIAKLKNNKVEKDNALSFYIFPLTLHSLILPSGDHLIKKGAKYAPFNPN